MRKFLLINSVKNQKFGKLFWQTLLSYISVLLFPVLICSLYYVHSYNVLRERTMDNQQLVLRNAGEQINSAFQDAVNLGTHLQLDEYVVALSNKKSTMSSSPTMDRYYLQKKLSVLQISNSIIQQINVYFPGDGYIVNTVSTYKRDLLSYMGNKTNTLSETDWQNILSSLEQDRIVCYSAPNKNFIAIAMPLLSDSDGNVRSLLCIQIDSNRLRDRLQVRNLLEYPCTFMLINKQQPLLIDGLHENIFSIHSCTEIFDYFSEGTLYSNLKWKKPEKLIISFCPLYFPDTALISVSEKSDFEAQTTRLLEFFLLAVLICILTGVAFIAYFSKRNYEPVSHIMGFLKKPGESIEPKTNEYQYILNRIIENRDEIEKQKEQLKNNYLQKLFTGEIAVNQISEQVAEQFSLNLAVSRVCMVLLVVNTPNNPENLEMVRFVIRNVYQELLESHFSGSSFSAQKQQISVLVSIPEKLEHPVELLKNTTETLISFLADSFSFELWAGISSIQPIDHIPDAWVQAGTALEYQKLFEAGRICLYDTISQRQMIGAIPLNTSEYVINLVTQGKRQQVLEYFDDIKKELEKQELSLVDIKSCYHFFYQATAHLQLYCQSYYGFCPDSLAFLSEDFFAQSLFTALSQTCEAYGMVSDEITRRNREISLWGNDICRFIENNYFDININLNTIAEHFRLSPSYLSKKFREQYQKSVIDYLYEIRIAKSLPLLDEQNLKIADIAQMIGFVDSNAFIRIFKKVKGITPGRYREIRQ